MKKTLFLFLGLSALFILSTNKAGGQIINTGPQFETFLSLIDDSEQPYTLYVPEDYDPDKTYPLVIMLHGAWANHRSGLIDVTGNSGKPTGVSTDPELFFPPIKNIQYIIAAPYARGTMGYLGIPEDDVYRVIEECKKNFKIDDDRVYLTGLSMGGGGTFYIGLSRPDLFAAIAPVCPAPPGETYDLLGNALNLPIAVFQGGSDPLVKPEGTRSIVKELRELGTTIQYTEFPDVGHDSWVYAYKDQAVFKLFDGIKRNMFPDRVRYTTRLYKYKSAYWVEFDKIKVTSINSIDAQFKGQNVIDVKTKGLEAFTLKLKGHPKFSVEEPLKITINGKKMESSSKYNHSFWIKDGKWEKDKYEPHFRSKQEGLEGPMSAAIYSRHIYVYGTADNPSREEMQKRREVAAKAADFSGGMSFGSTSEVNPRVVPDQRIRDEDMKNANLILFGTKETNSIIAKYQDRLPLELNAGALDEYGLVYGYSMDGCYMVVSSGIPFWITKPRDMNAPPPAQPENADVRASVNFMQGEGSRALVGMKDYFLFKTWKDDMAAEGYFDHEWNLTPADVAKLEESGVVTVNQEASPYVPPSFPGMR